MPRCCRNNIGPSCVIKNHELRESAESTKHTIHRRSAKVQCWFAAAAMMVTRTRDIEDIRLVICQVNTVGEVAPCDDDSERLQSEVGAAKVTRGSARALDKDSAHGAFKCCVDGVAVVCHVEMQWGTDPDRGRAICEILWERPQRWKHCVLVSIGILRGCTENVQLPTS